jgi:hypothetical protein
MSSLSSEIKDLRQRVERLERVKTKRGSCRQKDAAAYIGKSREYLRQLDRRGEGPPRNPDGTYPYDGLDAYQEGRLMQTNSA